MSARKPKENGQTILPFEALKLLAPPVRLVSAALWKVMKERDVMQYGIVEEFVTSACDTVPGLLTLKHQAKLTLGLRARLILELCKQPDPKTIAVHMKRIQVPASHSPSAVNMERDIRIQDAVKDFHAFIPVLLTDKAMRMGFFKEVFPVDFGPKYDQELEKLLWEFLIRLDQLLPVPNLPQTVSWLNDAPPVLEECARAATQPQLLKVLLQHQSCLGHLEAAASLPPNMGDSIIASLSLPPSGKLPSNTPAGFGVSDQSSFMSLCSNKTPLIKPVFGLISNDNMPMANTNEEGSENLLTESNTKYTELKEKQIVGSADQAENGGSSGVKRKHIDGDSASDEEDLLIKSRCVKKRITRNLHQINDDDSHCAIWVSCLKSQPKVKVERLLLCSGYDQDKNLPNQRCVSSVTIKHNSTSTQTRRNKASILVSDNKENTTNHPCSQRSSLQLKRIEHQDSPGENEDYVADSEDEATKNFKGRLFAKRYCKTKHGTYVPTLREYWKPCAERRTLLGPGSKQR
ncbi:TERF1-interacting nuclear factor 2 isoform X2 [Periophthalmus magnuspinnatus]|uniref:TERF1-interacting nuclear factor 2 isoform X2 n=1 Tax=Periophthalmus magnuspinnatus TaxID=409849 RepID=UPI002436D499|nr:TERF1-interacting nuclear factor 2 isoform X2 [Periophthalmus magnuspinnatus]